MGKFFYIIIISFFYLINSCAEIERSYDLSDSPFSEQIWTSSYDIVNVGMFIPANKLFNHDQTLIEKVGNTNPKNQKIFLLKKNSSGSIDWTIDLGISDDKSGISMTFDSLENVYITRYKRTFHEDNKDSEDFIVFLDKYSSSGKREWIKKLGRSKVEYGARLIVDSSDNIYVTGFSNLSGSNKILLEKYNTSGIREWTNTLDSTLIDFTWDVTVDSEDNIYTIGFSEKSFKQNISWQDVILHMRFNSDGIKL